jgi:integrase
MRRKVTMTAKVDAYLLFRRNLGFNLKIEGQMLRQFAAFADAADHHGPLTTELALRFATATTSVDRLYAARRLEVVRGFARHLAVTEPDTEIPGRGLLGRAHRRTTPHIYSEGEVANLILAAGRLATPNGLRRHTYRTLIGLVAATGLRISEALHLGNMDVDLSQNRLTIRQTKFRKTRLVPLHPTVTFALRIYVAARDQAVPMSATSPFFVSDRGTPLAYSTVHYTFRRLCEQANINGSRRRPRLHDLRHSADCRIMPTGFAA